jgi:hypothetical protein
LLEFLTPTKFSIYREVRRSEGPSECRKTTNWTIAVYAAAVPRNIRKLFEIANFVERKRENKFDIKVETRERDSEYPK